MVSSTLAQLFPTPIDTEVVDPDPVGSGIIFPGIHFQEFELKIGEICR